MTVLREELIENIAEKLDLEVAEARERLDQFINEIHEKTDKGEHYQIEGFGTFYKEEEQLHFDSAEELETEINYKYAGMEPVELAESNKDLSDDEIEEEPELSGEEDLEEVIDASDEIEEEPDEELSDIFGVSDEESEETDEDVVEEDVDERFEEETGEITENDEDEGEDYYVDEASDQEEIDQEFEEEIESAGDAEFEEEEPSEQEEIEVEFGEEEDHEKEDYPEEEEEKPEEVEDKQEEEPFDPFAEEDEEADDWLEDIDEEEESIGAVDETAEKDEDEFEAFQPEEEADEEEEEFDIEEVGESEEEEIAASMAAEEEEQEAKADDTVDSPPNRRRTKRGIGKKVRSFFRKINESFPVVPLLLVSVSVFVLGFGFWMIMSPDLRENVYEFTDNLIHSEQQVEQVDRSAGPAAGNRDASQPKRDSDNKTAKSKQEAATAGKETAKQDSESSQQSGGDDKAASDRSPPYGLKGNWHSQGSSYSLIIYSFTDRSNASEVVKKVKEEGYRSHVQQAEVDGTTYYRVAVGQFQSVDAAFKAAENMKKEYRENFFVRRIQNS